MVVSSEWHYTLRLKVKEEMEVEEDIEEAG